MCRSSQRAWLVRMPEDTLRDRDERGWLAPLISTAITLPAAAFAYLCAAATSMACDSCTPAEAGRFDPSFDIAFRAFRFGLAVPLGLLLASWALPWEPRYSALRVLSAVLAPPLRTSRLPALPLPRRVAGVTGMWRRHLPQKEPNH